MPQTAGVFDYVLTKGGGDVVFDHCMCGDYVISELYQYASLHVIFVSMVHMCCRLIKCPPHEGVVRLSLILSHPLDCTHRGHHIVDSSVN